MSSASKRRVKVVVNGKPYIVEVGDLTASPITVHVNGRPYLVDIQTAESGRAPSDTSVAALETVVRETSAPEKVPTPSEPAGPRVEQVKAPMPGNILDINVQPGDRVSFGQRLCALEAMKMKNAIRSPRDGTIATVAVSEGQTVAHGDVLFTFE